MQEQAACLVGARPVTVKCWNLGYGTTLVQNDVNGARPDQGRSTDYYHIVVALLKRPNPWADLDAHRSLESNVGNVPINQLLRTEALYCSNIWS